MKKEVWFIILMGLMLLQLSQILAEVDFDRYFPTNSEFEGMNLYNVKMYDSHNFKNLRVYKSYSGKYNAPDTPPVAVKITITRFTQGPTINSVIKSYSGEGYQCSAVNERTLECIKVEKDNSAEWNPNVYQYHSYYRGERVIGEVEVCADDPSMFCSETGAISVEVFVTTKYNITNPLPPLGRSVMNLVSSKISGEYKGTAPQIQILSPRDGETLYFESGKPLTFTIKVAVKDDDLTYAGAHYESGTPKTIMIGGELEPKLGSSGGTGSQVITLQPDEIAEGEGKIKAYARDSTGNEVEKTITVYLLKKPISTSSAVPSTSSTTPSVSSTTSTPPSSRAPIEGKQEAGDPSKFNNPFRGIRVEGMLSKEANVRMEITLDKLKGIGSTEGLETVEVKTPYGKDVKVLQKDEKVEAKKGSSLWFKLKYYTGKALDKVIDSATGALDSLVEKVMPSPVGLFKDYVKAYKDSQLFKGDEATKKTMQDLHVSKEGAESYNEMSGIEDRQLASSPYKNLAPSNPLTKPFEFTFGALEKGFKRHLANNYKWEFEKTAKTAMYYKKAGMKYEDIVALTIRDVEEETSFSRQVQTMNAQSKGKYQSQRERLKFYLKKLREEGKI